MHDIDQIYIDGAFVTPHGSQRFDLYDPSSAEIIGSVRLADTIDVDRAVAAAKRAFPAFSQTSVAERITLLWRLRDAVSARADDIRDAMILEYGAPLMFATFSAQNASNVFDTIAQTIADYPFVRTVGVSEVDMQPVGIAAMITPWNSNAGFICSKLAAAIGAGCTAVVKPSEMSAIQTRVVTEALHEAGLPAGVINIVTGLGSDVGAALVAHRDIAKISFTGSTAVGKSIVRGAADTMKRVTLELGGKSPTLILEDADLTVAVRQALMIGFMNSGQACIAGTRILVPEARRDEVVTLVKAMVDGIVVGRQREPDSLVGPMVSARQYARVQAYIAKGIEEGATLVVGGTGHPDGLDGYFVKPTIFADVTNDMTIAREEIFGPVLSILTYRDHEDAIHIANDTDYGLSAYVLGSDADQATRVAARLDAGRVVINNAPHDPLAPFGGFKQSGIGREYGSFGLEAYLEPKAILRPKAR
jgi:aldehyde dehydrogenase (NAD+)